MVARESLAGALRDLTAAAAKGETGGAPGRVSLRTLIWIRWVALGGQLATVLFVQLGLGFDLPMAGVLATIGASVLVNLLAVRQRRHQPRIGDRQAWSYIAFDVVQLAALLFLTGGLVNPFAMLMLAPVAMGATVLSRSSTVWLTAVALILLAILALSPMPLPWHSSGIAFPPLYLLGIWFALTVAMVFMAAYAWRLAEESRQMADALTATQVALSREQRVSALGALAAATAHELGSPLSTIALAAKEIANDLPGDDPLQEDVALVRSQAERCREILTQLAERPVDSSSTSAHPRPLSEIVERAAQPHLAGTSQVRLALHDVARTDEPEPRLSETPELVHGLGNLIQNAAQFAQAEVAATVGWDAQSIWVAISDDGPGFPQSLLARLDEPYLAGASRRSDSEDGRGGGHLGLGIFIAQTLLGRTGAKLAFRNRARGGAEVVVSWQRPILRMDAPGNG